MRYFIGFLLTIGLIIVVILLLFSGGGKSTVPNTAKTLASYANTDTEVRMTIDGPINSNQAHQQIQITIDNQQATYQQFQGYDGGVINTKSYANTQNSYSAFLHAIEYAGFTKGTASKAGSEAGYCAGGERYVFEIIQNGKDIERFWATSCGNPKTYGGNLNYTVGLFETQIPDFGTLSQNFVY